MHPHVDEEEHRREVPSWVMMKTMAMAWALGEEVQREVESLRCSNSGEWVSGEGLEVYASRIDATTATRCKKDLKIYEKVSTSMDYR